MKKIVFLLLLVMAAVHAQAWDDGQHYTQHGDDALTAKLFFSNEYDMWVVELSLKNSQNYIVLQSDIVVDANLFEFMGDHDFTNRVKVKSGMSGMKETHKLTSKIWDSGFLRMVISSLNNDTVQGREGAVCYFGMKVKEGAVVDKAMEYPVNLTNIVLARNNYIDGVPHAQAYYLHGTIADPTYNCYDGNCRSAAIYGQLSSAEWDSFRDAVATTPWQVDIDLTQCTMTGLWRVAPEESDYNFANRYNKNNLLYVKERSQVNNRNENVIVVNENGTAATEAFTLHEDGKLFYAKMNFNADKASYDRAFSKDRWSTVCLPFSIHAEALASLKDRYDMIVHELVDYDKTNNCLKFVKADEMVANKPYIICTGIDCTPFKDMDFATTVAKSSDMADIVVGNGLITMFGTFDTQYLSTSAEVAYYGFNASTGEFFLAGSNCTLLPFRACIAITGEQGVAPAKLGVKFDAETGISSINTRHQAVEGVYNLQGIRMNDSNASKLEKGVYIINGQKHVVR